jgi:hypothetical protein
VGSQVGATPILRRVCHKKPHEKKLLMMRNGTPPDVEPPSAAVRMGSEYPDAAIAPFSSPRVDHIAHLSRPERQRCSWGACRESDGRAAALSHHTHAPVRRKPHGDAFPAFISQLQGAPGGLQPGRATGAAGRTRSSERPRLVHGSAGRHQLATLPSSSIRGATFDAAERGHVVGTLSGT